MIILRYNKQDINEVRKTYEVLTVRLGMNIQATLDLMQSDIANVNAEQWSVELKQTINVYKEWTADIWVTRGEQVTHNGVAYNVIQSHQTQIGWEPQILPALFNPMPVQYPGENYPRWRQPLGSEDSYKQNDRVSWNGTDWSSDINANVFEPGVSSWTDLNVVVPPAYPAWVPWPGSGPTYQIGDRVSHNGFNWENTSPNNVFEPGVFGWVQI